MSVLLPFRSATLNYDSIQEVESLFEDRNLYTIALDFYSGILFAIEDLKQLKVSVNLNVFDTENSRNKILEISKTYYGNLKDVSRSLIQFDISYPVSSYVSLKAVSFKDLSNLSTLPPGRLI